MSEHVAIAVEYYPDGYPCPTSIDGVQATIRNVVFKANDVWRVCGDFSTFTPKPIPQTDNPYSIAYYAILELHRLATRKWVGFQASNDQVEIPITLCSRAEETVRSTWPRQGISAFDFRRIWRLVRYYKIHLTMFATSPYDIRGKFAPQGDKRLNALMAEIDDFAKLVPPLVDETVHVTSVPQQHTITTEPERVSHGQTGDPRPEDKAGKPSQDRQDDILAVVKASGVPLQRAELVEKMGLSTEGKIGQNLAWMVKNGILINIPQRGYWPKDIPPPA